MRKSGWITAAVAVLALAATTATAQMMPGPGPGGGQRENMNREVEAIKISRLTEALKLDERTAATFVPLITGLDATRRTLMGERRQLLFELRRQLDAQRPDEKKLSAILDKLRKNEQGQMETRDKEYDAARTHLTVQQQARYVVFQMEFNREVRGIIKDMRGVGPGKGMGPGMGSGRPGGPPGPGGMEQK